MITDRAIEAVKAWVESRATSYPVVDEWTIVTPATDTVKTYPLLTISCTGAEEHPVLRGVMHPLTIELKIETTPNVTGATDLATTGATHNSYAEALYEIAADYGAVSYMDGILGISVWESKGNVGITGTEDGRRSSSVEMRITCCNE